MELQIIESAPWRAKMRWRGELQAHEVLAAPTIEFTPAMLAQIVEVFKQRYEGRLYDIGELLRIEWEDNGAFLRWLGNRLDFGSEYKVCSSLLAQIWWDLFGYYPFLGDTPETPAIIHTVPAAYWASLPIITLPEYRSSPQPGQIIISFSEETVKAYEFWLKAAYKRIRVANQREVPLLLSSWGAMHISQIVAVR